MEFGVFISLVKTARNVKKCRKGISRRNIVFKKEAIDYKCRVAIKKNKKLKYLINSNLI